MIKRGPAGLLLGGLLWIVPMPAAVADLTAQDHRDGDHSCWEDRDDDGDQDDDAGDQDDDAGDQDDDAGDQD
ncbi:MAG: hypothetical protein ACRDYV_06105, partial [Acidimicrobiia bacterium]